VFERQELCVVSTLPQDSADTSKTDSKRKEGALYCFFFRVPAADSRALSLLELSMFKCYAPCF
jgi:hypothetical protein